MLFYFWSYENVWGTSKNASWVNEFVSVYIYITQDRFSMYGNGRLITKLNEPEKQKN